jgi:hypothetical protein
MTIDTRVEMDYGKEAHVVQTNETLQKKAFAAYGKVGGRHHGDSSHIWKYRVQALETMLHEFMKPSVLKDADLAYYTFFEEMRRDPTVFPEPRQRAYRGNLGPCGVEIAGAGFVMHAFCGAGFVVHAFCGAVTPSPRRTL